MHLVFNALNFLLHCFNMVVVLENIVLQALDHLVVFDGRHFINWRCTHGFVSKVTNIRQTFISHTHSQAFDLFSWWWICTYEKHITILRNVLKLFNIFTIQCIDGLKRDLSSIHKFGALLNDLKKSGYFECILQILPICITADQWTNFLGNIEIILCNILIDVNSQLFFYLIPCFWSSFRPSVILLLGVLCVLNTWLSQTIVLRLVGHHIFESDRCHWPVICLGRLTADYVAFAFVCFVTILCAHNRFSSESVTCDDRGISILKIEEVCVVFWRGFLVKRDRWRTPHSKPITKRCWFVLLILLYLIFIFISLLLEYVTVFLEVNTVFNEYDVSFFK